MEITKVPFGFIKEGKIYRSAWAIHPDREIGEVRDEDVEKSTHFFQERFSDLEKKIREVTEKIDATENKGSYLMKLIHLKEQLPAHDGLGDYQQLHDEIDRYESLVKDIIYKNRIRNTEIKSGLIEEAKLLDDIINWKEATEKAQDLKTRWIKTGSAEEDRNAALEEAFWAIISAFFEKKKQFFDDKQKLTEHRKRQYEELVIEAEELKNLHGKERFDKVKLLKERWNGTGGIPAEFYKPLFEEFNSHLKSGKSSFKKLDYTAILIKLNEVKADARQFEKKEMDQIKKDLFKDRNKSDDKRKVLELIQILSERDFILKLSNKRFPDFAKMDKEKKRNIKKGIIKDLIQRDEEDLKIYEANAANFTSSDGSMNKLVENKIRGQKKKIAVKTKLLEWVASGEF